MIVHFFELLLSCMLLSKICNVINVILSTSWKFRTTCTDESWPDAESYTKFLHEELSDEYFFRAIKLKQFFLYMHRGSLIFRLSCERENN
jgi:hypothetical protein